MFTCKALEIGFPGGKLPPFNSQDFAACPEFGFEFHQSDQLPQNVLDYDLVAYVHLYLEVEPGWENGLIAIALQRLHKLDNFRPVTEGSATGFRTNISHEEPKPVWASEVEKLYRFMQTGDNGKRVYDYWKQYDKSTKSSSVTHPFSSPAPNHEEVEARFKACLWNWKSSSSRTWSILNGIESWTV